MTEDVEFRFVTSSFGYSDPDGNPILGVVITSLPAVGSLQLDGQPVSVGDRVIGIKLFASHLAYVPPANFNGSVSFTYEVIDAGTHQGTDQTPNTITLDIAPVNDAPVITSGNSGTDFQLDVIENVAAGAIITTVTSGDIDGPTATYSVSGADAAMFAIDAAYGALSFRLSPDFEAPRDVGADNVYNIAVTVSDGSLTDTQNLSVVVHSATGNTIGGTKKGDTVDASHSIGGKGATDEEDTIDGKKGNDKLSSLAANDTLIGGKGRDTLIGGSGFDRLDGGKDGDQFVFSAKLAVAGVDTIVTFEHDKDRIALDDKVFKAIGSSLSSGEFYAKAGAVAAKEKDDRIVYNKTTRDLYFDKDGKGGAAAVHIATLLNHPTSLDHGDFLIV